MNRTDPRRERRLGCLVFAGVSWVIFHVWSAIYNGVHSIDHGGGLSCGWQGWALTAAYLLSLLAFDGLAYFARSRTAGGVLAKFWAVCGAATALLAVMILAGAERFELMLLLVLLLPAAPLIPLLELAARDLGPMLAVVFALCAGHIIYFLWLYRLAKGREAVEEHEIPAREESE